MAAVKKIPMRTCLGCGQMKPKKELIRVVRTPTGEIALDTTGKKPGRGAYICPDVQCLRKARKAGRFQKNLDCPISEEIYATLERELEGYEDR